MISVFALICTVLDIKLRDSTDQVKVHEVKRKKCAKWKEKRQEISAPLLLDVKSIFPASSHPTSHPLIKTVLTVHNPAGEAPGGWADPSHGQRDEAVVSLDVPLQDLRARPQHTLEAWPVQFHALEGSAGDNGGGPGTVQQQGDLTWMEGRRNRKRRINSSCVPNLLTCSRKRWSLHSNISLEHYFLGSFNWVGGLTIWKIHVSDGFDASVSWLDTFFDTEKGKFCYLMMMFDRWQSCIWPIFFGFKQEKLLCQNTTVIK